MQISRDQKGVFVATCCETLSCSRWVVLLGCLLLGGQVCAAQSYVASGNSWALPDPDTYEEDARQPRRSSYQSTQQQQPAAPQSTTSRPRLQPVNLEPSLRERVETTPGQTRRYRAEEIDLNRQRSAYQAPQRYQPPINPPANVRRQGSRDGINLDLPEEEPQRRMGGGPPMSRPDPPVIVEYNLEASYAMQSSVAQGDRTRGDIDTTYWAGGFRVKPKAGPIRLTFGAQGERYTFEHDDAIPIPDRFHSGAFIVGADIPVDRQWAVRILARPGVYGTLHDGVSGDDLNVPFLIGASYFHDPNLQIIFGLAVDFWRETPVVGGGGLRWRFHDQWTLNLLFPNPRIEYKPAKETTLYLGAEFKGGNFRTHEGFGSAFDESRDSRLDNAIVSYREIRTGAGLIYQPHPEFRFNLESGLQVHREWHFHRADTKFKNEDLAPYFKLDFSGKF